MKRKMILVMMTTGVILSLAACGKKSVFGTKIVHCDNCGEEVKVSADSAMDDSWTIYCEKCNKELGIDDKMIDIIQNN